MNRLSWIDAAKGISIILVVLLHIIDELIPKKDITHTIEFLYQMERSIGRVAVPVFIMISGFLIINKMSLANVKNIIINRVPVFIALTISYSFITNLIFNIMYLNEFSPLLSFEQSFNLNKTHAYQMWFMPVIVLLYVISPALRFFTLVSNNTNLVAIVTLVSLVIFIPTTALAINNESPISIHIPPVHYILYFLIGYIVIENSSKIKFSRLYMASAFIISIIVTSGIAITAEHSMTGSAEAVSWYTSIFTLISSILFISLIMPMKPANNNPIVKIGRSSFGIYLFHLIPMFVVIKMCQASVIPLVLSIPISLVLTLLCCLLFTWLMSKNKYTKLLIA